MARTIFVGIDRGEKFRQELTRKNLSILMGIPYSAFREHCDWENLYGDASAPPGSDAEEDRRRAIELVPKLARYEETVLLGNRVAKAFGCSEVPLYSWTTLPTSPPIRVARMPHTSRQNWNTRGRGEGPYWEPAKHFVQTLRCSGSSLT